MTDSRIHDLARAPAESREQVGVLRQLCRQGRLYDVKRWIAEGNPLQLAPGAIPKGTRPKTALQIALETGQHSLAVASAPGGSRGGSVRVWPIMLR